MNHVCWEVEMALGQGYAQQDCSMARALEIVGERWTLLVLRDLFYGVRRFSDLADHLDLPRAVLAQRLRALVDAGLVHQTADRSYELTRAALGLWPTIYGLAQWGERQAPAPRGRRRIFGHTGCGDLGSDGRCTGCGARPGPADVTVRPGRGADQTLRSDRVSVALRHEHRLLTPLLPPS